MRRSWKEVLVFRTVNEVHCCCCSAAAFVGVDRWQGVLCAWRVVA
jgi:hypothetical protein